MGGYAGVGRVASVLVLVLVSGVDMSTRAYENCVPFYSAIITCGTWQLSSTT